MTENGKPVGAPQFRVTPAADADIINALNHSREQFGYEARVRYELLINAALKLIVDRPAGIGSSPRAELGAGVYFFHLAGARNNVPLADRVRRPRHYVAYRILLSGEIVIGGVLHDSTDPARHINESTWR